MKKIIAIVLVSMVLLCSGAVAETLPIDLATINLEQLMALRTEIDAAIQKIQASEAPTDQLESATRKAPAMAGQTVKLVVKSYNMSYTVLVTVKEIYRGEAYKEFIGKRYQPDLKDENGEYIAAKVAVTFLSIEESEEEDPELLVDAVFSFKCYNGEGAQYDSICYSVSKEAELKPIYEGATTEGFMQFEVNKADSAPYLVYTPDMFEGTSAWFRLS